MEKLLIVDGNSILNRAFYGIRPLNAPDGTPTNAVYGFLNILSKYIDEEPPDYICVAFDVKAKTFRHKKYELYKAQRKPSPEDLNVQFPVIKEILDAMNCVRLELEGYEADDIIGTISRVCAEKGIECSILTGDKDDLQLADRLVKIKLVVTRGGSTQTTVYGPDEVFERYGVTPSEFIDVKGLMGDPSDNIPGVAGIGEKTALSLIQKYKSISALYENLDSGDFTPSVRKKLEAGRDMAYLSRELSEIDRNVPVETDLEKFRRQEPDFEKLVSIYKRLNFKIMLEKLLSSADASFSNIKEEKFEVNYENVSAQSALKIITDSGKLFYKLNGSSLMFSADGENIFYVENTDSDFLKAVFENGGIKKYGFGVKRDILSLNKLGVEYSGLSFDVEIAAYISDPSSSGYKLSDLLASRLGITLSGENIQSGMQLSMDFGAGSASELAEDVFAVLKLVPVMESEIKENGQEKLYYEIELPLIETLANMEIVGVRVDRDALSSFGHALSAEIDMLETQIYDEAGENFNINSPKQLGSILFENLGLPHGKKTKTGYSTGADVLNKLVGVHPIIEHILSFRHMTKLRSTYVDGLLAVIDPKTGRIHSNFNQTVTATGRISSTEPNLQNIPVRTPLGREMRKMFIADGEDKILIDADYSQIELRVLAHIADDKNMQEAFLSGEDIHARTASQVFGVPLETVTPEMRSRSKAVNFGIVYGIGAFSLAQDLKISVKEAKEYIENYLKTFPSVKEYMSETVKRGEKDGYVSTMFERRRYIPELRASNKITHAFGERVAMNAPIQGTAADIIKIAMVNVHKRLKEENLKSKLILQIHDELIIEADINEAERVKELLRHEMENAVTLKVPLAVDLHTGKSWFETK